jgi:lipopolysaccharide export system permease protein
VETARSDLAASLVRPGQFSHPVPGLTVYAQSIDDDGTIRNLFINQARPDGRDVTVTAREGRLLKRGGAPVLIMKNGASQEVSKTGVLNFLAFDEYDFDLRPLMAVDTEIHYKTSDRFLHELFFPDLRQDWERSNRKKLWAEGHSRLASPLYNLGFMALALAAVIGGSFSRLGYNARMTSAAVTALVVRTLGFAAQAAAGGAPVFNILQYLLPLSLLAASSMVIFGRPRPGEPRAALAVAGAPA